MDWTPILTVVATGAATLSGVWLNGRITARSDERKAAAERQKLDLEHSREVERQGREDATERKREERRQADEDAVRGQEVVDALLKGLRDVRDFEEVDEEGFRTYFTSKWSSRLDLIVRPLVGRIRSDDARNRLVVVMNALDDSSTLAEEAFAMAPREFAESTILLGAELASAIARGQEPDASLMHKYESLVENIEALKEHRRNEYRMRVEERRERLRAEKVARLAEERSSIGDNVE